VLSRCDLHVHSRYSTDTGNYALKRARLGESYTDPERVYRVSKERGMRFVTISDHNTVEGALRIAHLPDTFLSVEVTTRLPEDDVPLHVLVWNLSEQDHRDLQPLRPSVDELVAFLCERGLAHALAHPLYRMGAELTPAHIERLLGLFTVWEGRNGARPEEANVLATRLAVARGIGLSGGSDDHGALDIASTWTEADGATAEEFLAGVMAGTGRPGGAHGSTLKLAHALASLAVNAYREAGGDVSPLAAGQLRALFDDDALDPGARHAEIRAVSRQLARLLGARVREGADLRRLDSIGTRLSALVSAVAVQAPYVATANHHAASRAGLGELEEAFFGTREEAHDGRALVFSDTFDEANGVAGTMRRLATEGEHGALPVRVATARAEAGEEAGVISFAPDWTLPLPSYERLELRFPLVTDVLERVEAEPVDVIHVATPGPVGLCGLVAARVLGVPLVGSYHTELGPYALHLTRDLLVAQAMDLWVDWFYRQCALVLAPTTAVADALRVRGHEHVTVWGRGVDTSLFSPHRRSDLARDRLLGDGRALLLSVGRVSDEKRLDVLLEAYGRVRERRPEVRLAVVGDGPARTRLEADAPPGVRFLGELRGEELAEVYASADVFCFPSTTDTFGQVLLESAASGLPAVAAAAGGALELVQHRATGIVVAPDDVEAFAAALGELVDDPRLRLSLGRRALSAAQSRTWAASYRQLLDAYEAVAGRPLSAPHRIAA
jgi:glycosyltransferase involved in cell wall biosynthesis/predicted metal-dependent phosphoesterase TrpH